MEKAQLLCSVYKKLHAFALSFSPISHLLGSHSLLTLHCTPRSPRGPPALCLRAFAHAISFVWNALPCLASGTLLRGPSRPDLLKGRPSIILGMSRAPAQRWIQKWGLQVQNQRLPSASPEWAKLRQIWVSVLGSVESVY